MCVLINMRTSGALIEYKEIEMGIENGVEGVEGLDIAYTMWIWLPWQDLAKFVFNQTGLMTYRAIDVIGFGESWPRNVK